MVSKTEARPPALEAWVRLLRGHSAATRALNAQLLRDHGLTINDYEALLLLADAEDRSVRRADLARDLELTASGVTRLLEGLERAGLVEKAACPRDGRVTYAVLTDLGRTKLAEASCSHVAAIDRLFGRYTPDELATLARLLGRLPEAYRTRCAPVDSGDDVPVEAAVAAE
jgi:DNA-binding MarR family transcriptional regulator